MQILEYQFESDFNFEIYTYLYEMIILFSNLLKILGIVIPLLISIAYLTIAERKLIGSIQRRKGPNVVGFLGFWYYF